jgi:hypothetical protein
MSGSDSGIFLVEPCRKLYAPERVNSHFERRDAKQPPFGVGDRLDERFFGSRRRFVLVEKSLDVLLVSCGFFAGQQDGAAGQSGFHGVEGRFAFALGRFRAGRELSVGLIGADLRI